MEPHHHCLSHSSPTGISELSFLGIAQTTHPDRHVPASRGHWSSVGGAFRTHTLSAAPAVVDLEFGVELLLAGDAVGDLAVWDPVGWPGGLY